MRSGNHEIHAAPPSARQSSSFRVVAGGLLAVTLLAIVGMAFAYFKMLHYEPVAALHLPSDTRLAARVNLENVLLFEPVRKHVLPLMTELDKEPSRAKSSLAKRLEQKTGVNLWMDLRELLVARGPSSDDWLLALGGIVPDVNLLSGLRDFLNEAGFQGWSLSMSGDALLHRPSGVAVGQAEDRIVLVASDIARLRSALPVSDVHRRLGLDPGPPASFAIAAKELHLIARSPIAALSPIESRVTEVTSFGGQINLDDAIRLRARATFSPDADLEAFESESQSVLIALQRLAALSPGSDAVGLLVLLSRAQLERRGPTVELSTNLERHEVDALAKGLANSLRAWLVSSR